MSGVDITYTSLVALIPSYMEQRGSAFIAQVDTFINLAENRIATDMKQEGFQSVVTGNMALNNVQAKPAFWRENISFQYKLNGEWKMLKLRTLEWIKRYWPNVNETGAPEYYADYNINNFYIAATPGVTYPFELTYYARLDPLSAANDSNWLTLNAPQALLYACLLEAALWLKNPESEAKWEKQYQISCGGLLTEDASRKKDRNSHA